MLLRLPPRGSGDVSFRGVRNMRFLAAISFKDENSVFFLFKYGSIMYEDELPLSLPSSLILSFHSPAACSFMVLSLTGNISLLFSLTCTIKNGKNFY